MKKIELVLDDDRYNVLVQALTDYTQKFVTALTLHYPEKERVLAEQMLGLVTTQWTGSRTYYTSQEVEAITGSTDITADQLATIASKFDENASDLKHKSNIMPVHIFKPSKDNLDKCERCGMLKLHAIHQLSGLENLTDEGENVSDDINDDKKVTYHEFEPSTNLDGTINYRRCRICHKGQKNKIHS